MNKNLKTYLFLFLIFIFKMLFLVPVKVMGGIANVNEYRHISIFKVLINKNECGSVIDGFCYKILVDKYIIEGFLLLIVSLILFHFIYKIFKKGDK